MIKLILLIVLLILIYAIIILSGSISFNNSNCDYLIVLGHQLINNNPSSILIRRLNKAILYLNNCKNTKVIVSGGVTSNNTISEAYVMKEYLVSNNIDLNRIIVEDKSKNTIDNFVNSFKLIEKNKKICVLSSNYHMLRSRMIAKMLSRSIKCVSVYTPIKELFIHLAIEEVYLIKHYLYLRKNKN